MKNFFQKLFSRKNYKKTSSLTQLNRYFSSMGRASGRRFRPYMKWGLLILFVFLLSHVTIRYIRYQLKSSGGKTVSLPNPTLQPRTTTQPRADYPAIIGRNIFDKDGFIPEPFNQGMLGCFEQASPAGSAFILLGTIVMTSEKHSVALVSRGRNTEPDIVKIGETFLDQYTALAVERNRLCFQNNRTQELRYLESEEDLPAIATQIDEPSRVRTRQGIDQVSDGRFQIEQSFLDSQMANMRQILQTARAVPYTDQNGNFGGFLIQAIQDGSLFKELGLNAGDILKSVNGVKLDGPGKGLEVFHMFKENASNIQVELSRSGQQKTINYEVKP